MIDHISMKRVNFFRGFLVTEKDFNDQENYHAQRRALHNMMMHSPGVVMEGPESLRVSQLGRPGLNVEIAPGYAIDGFGREIVVPETVMVSVDPQQFRLPQIVFVIAEFAEEPSDYIEYADNRGYRGHSRITESARIGITARQPDIRKEVELARIRLEPGVTAILDAIDPLFPQPNEIDLGHVPLAAVSGAHIPRATERELDEILSEMEKIHAHLAYRRNIIEAVDVVHSTTTMRMLLSTKNVNFMNTHQLFRIIVEHQGRTADAADSRSFALAATPQFGTYRWNIEALLAKKFNNLKSIEDFIAIEKNATGAIASLFANDMRVSNAGAQDPVVTQKSAWEQVKTNSDGFHERLTLKDHEFRLVDVLDIFDENSEKTHHFVITGEKDRYRSRQRLKYPDSTVVEDVGVHFEGGAASFEISNIEPNRDVILVTRIDYVRGNYECGVEVNGKRAPNMVVPGNDMVYRWRNWPVTIPANMVDQPSLKIRISPQKQDRDVNIFTIWAYQPA